MHKFEKRDAKSRTLVILAVVGLAAALTVGIFTAVRMFHKPAQSKDDPKTGIVYDDSAIEGGWDNLSPEEIAEKLNEKVAEGMINISMNTAPYFENGASEGNVMIVNESINNYPQKSRSSATIPANRFTRATQFQLARRLNARCWTLPCPPVHTSVPHIFITLTRNPVEIIGTAGAIITITIKN